MRGNIKWALRQQQHDNSLNPGTSWNQPGVCRSNNNTNMPCFRASLFRHRFNEVNTKVNQPGYQTIITSVNSVVNLLVNFNMWQKKTGPWSHNVIISHEFTLNGHCLKDARGVKLQNPRDTNALINTAVNK